MLRFFAMSNPDSFSLWTVVIADRPFRPGQPIAVNFIQNMI
jgi:hypothetical protein